MAAAAQQAPMSKAPEKKNQKAPEKQDVKAKVTRPVGIAIMAVLLCLALVVGNGRALSKATPKAFLSQGDVASIVEDRVKSAKNAETVARRAGLDESYYAAVDEAVKQVRAYRREGFSGVVNGVLRNLIRARDGGTLALPDRESEPAKWLSVKYSVAQPVVNRLIDAYGFETAEQIAAYAPSRREQTVRPNRMRMDGPAFEAWLDQRQFHWRGGVAEDAYIIEDGGNLAALDGYRRGDFSIQGESAMLAAQAVQARPGMQILDACAAPGGKTCLMAERMGGSGRVHAWDVHEHRVELIRAAARRLGLDNVRPAQRDARVPVDSMALSMDAVLVDAPCSGLGVIADKPDIKYRQNDESLDALPPLQLAILDSCAGTVRVGGLLVYATCTILPAENGDVVRAFLEKHPEFAPDADDSWQPEALRLQFADG